MIGLIWRVENVFQLYRHAVVENDSHMIPRIAQKSGTAPAVPALLAPPTLPKVIVYFYILQHTL